MRFDEYRRYDGLGLAELIANTEISVSDLRGRQHAGILSKGGGASPAQGGAVTTRNGKSSRLP